MCIRDRALSANEEVHLREKGLLSELAVNINKTSDILQTQSRQLRKKETARANWIAGVSHDIRTPLSMVMGYAGQLENDLQLSEDTRKKATVIVRQSKRMRNPVSYTHLDVYKRQAQSKVRSGKIVHGTKSIMALTTVKILFFTVIISFQPRCV